MARKPAFEASYANLINQPGGSAGSDKKPIIGPSDAEDITANCLQDVAKPAWGQYLALMTSEEGRAHSSSSGFCNILLGFGRFVSADLGRKGL
jgi:hypothetical protein